jgi:hypothetical protein
MFPFMSFSNFIAGTGRAALARWPGNPLNAQQPAGRGFRQPARIARTVAP